MSEIDIDALIKRIRILEEEVALLTKRDHGNPYQLLQTVDDMYPCSDEAGILRKAQAWYNSLTSGYEGFDGLLMPSGWSWASSPFATPLGTSFSVPSVLAVTWSATSGERCFLYRSAAPSVSPYCVASVGLSTTIIGAEVGLRLDDGSDSNYVEAVIQHGGYLTATYVTKSCVGGSLTTRTATISGLLNDCLMRMNLGGTKWSAWTMELILGRPFGAAGLSTRAGITVPSSGSLTWTPTRTGLVFNKGPSTATWMAAYVDWVQLT